LEDIELQDMDDRVPQGADDRRCRVPQEFFKSNYVERDQLQTIEKTEAVGHEARYQDRSRIE